jgi:hypothetical protein
MTQKALKISVAEDKELKMQRPKGYATTRILIFVIALILIVLFFLS